MHARARAEFLIDAYRSNLRLLSAHAGAALLLPIKADAYGHGAALAVEASRDLPQVWGYAVATPREVLAVLAARPGKPVLLLTPPAPDEVEELAALGVRLPVTSREDAARLPERALAHVKVNTGMNRLGVRPEAAAEVAGLLHERGQLEGIYTHFAGADSEDLSSARAQLALFREVVRASPSALAHASNSGGVLSFGRDAAFDLVRPGISAYGYAPEPHLRGRLPLTPALRLVARVTFLHDVPAGESVSYGGLWTATRDTRVAVIGVGYADGYPRGATLSAHVTVRGERRPVLGRICMDQCMVDVTGLDVRVGDDVEVFGPHGVTADDVAGWAGTISYEVLTGIGARVERVAVRDAQPDGVHRTA